MTTVAMSLGSAVAVGDLRILAANISLVRNGLQFAPGTTIFVSSVATLTLAASVLGAGVLGDKYGMKRMFVAGAYGAVVFGFIGAAAPNVAVLMIARAGIGVAFAFLTGLSLAIMNAVSPPAVGPARLRSISPRSTPSVSCPRRWAVCWPSVSVGAVAFSSHPSSRSSLC